MSRYILAPFAQEDLISIRDYYLGEGGPRVARKVLVEFVEAFQKLARNPGIGHRRQDLVENRPLLFFAVRAYLIIYRSETRPLEIVAIVRASRDVPSLLEKHRTR